MNISKDEKIVLVLGAVALVALFLVHRPRAIDSPIIPTQPNPVDQVGVSFTPDNSSLVHGPRYLTYNQRWAFAPPIGNILPTMTMGQENQVDNYSPAIYRSSSTVEDF